MNPGKTAFNSLYKIIAGFKKSYQVFKIKKPDIFSQAFIIWMG